MHARTQRQVATPRAPKKHSLQASNDRKEDVGLRGTDLRQNLCPKAGEAPRFSFCREGFRWGRDVVGEGGAWSGF